MTSNLFYYKNDFVYHTILLRIDRTGYIIEQADESMNQIEVSYRLFPFIKRRFIIRIIKINDLVCSISVIQKNGSINTAENEQQLIELLTILF